MFVNFAHEPVGPLYTGGSVKGEHGAMIRLFKHYIPHAVLLLGVCDAVALLVAAEIGWVVRAHQIGIEAGPVWHRIPRLVAFAASLQLAMVGVGVYSAGKLHSMRYAAARLLVAVSLGVIVQSVVFFLLPTFTLWRSSLFYALLTAMVMLMALRLVLARAIGGEAFRRRLVVLGAGPRAARLKELCAQTGASCTVAGFVAMAEAGRVLPEAIPREYISNLAEHVIALGATEVVLAIEERRNALPLADLLRVKTTGVEVSELSSFLERETGRIDLQSVNPSWLIFSDGFSSGRMLSGIVKRLFDVTASLVLLVLTAPILLVTAIAIRLESRGPIFYRQRRVGLFNEPFDIPKFRSMRTDAEAGGVPVWAAKADPRVTRVGRIIRKIRVDEIPQAWSVLKGEMSFVGPRPERPQFVESLERELPFYAERHMVKPGITGWAQINYPYGASIEDARHKLEYDLYYAKNYSPFLDLLILLQTLRVVLWPEGAR